MSATNPGFNAATTTTMATILLATAIVTLAFLFMKRDKSDIPHFNPPGWFSLVTFSQIEAAKNGMELFTKAKKRFHDAPFRMIKDNGDMLILPPRFANTIRNEVDLDFAKAIMSDFHAHVPGFTPIRIIGHEGQVMQNLVRKQLTKLLGKLMRL
jgi:hypothetical protein